MVLLRSIFALSFVGFVSASPVNIKRQAITTLSPTQVNEFAPFTHFASAAYCQPSTTINWSCGVNCNANPDFQAVASGGDGARFQFWYVGFSPSLKTVIVAHQGTDPHKLLSLLADADFFLFPLNSTLFPGVPLDVEAHVGFSSHQAGSASMIFSAVQIALSKLGASSVTVVGHSLGGALALLDGVYFRLQLPQSVSVKVITYGMPRVGNQAFADFVDSTLSGLVTHVNNREDPIPTVPGIFLKFHHPSGEIHIQDSGTWDACPGQDNPSDLCIVGDVENIFEGHLERDHDGPYAGITMGC